MGLLNEGKAGYTPNIIELDDNVERNDFFSKQSSLLVMFLTSEINIREFIVTEETALHLQVRSPLHETTAHETTADSSQPSVPLAQRLSMNETTTYRWSFLEDVLGYQKAGINTMGVWYPKLIDYGEERGIELLQDAGMSVSSLSWAGGFTGGNSHSYLDSVDDALAALELAGKLKAKSLVLVSGARAGHTMNHARNIFVDALNVLMPLAKSLNVALAIQPMAPSFAYEWTFLTRLDDALQIIDTCNHPQVQLVFDVYHLWKTPQLLSRIQEIASRTTLVQLSDSVCSPSTNYERLLPGEGDIPVADIIQAFEEAGYQGDYEFNIWSEELWKTPYAPLLVDCKKRYQNVTTTSSPSS